MPWEEFPGLFFCPDRKKYQEETYEIKKII